MEYVWSNKYVLVALGVLTLTAFLQWIKIRRLDKNLSAMQNWSKDIYESQVLNVQQMKNA